MSKRSMILVLACMVTVITAGSASANVFVDWLGSAGFYWTGTGDGILAPDGSGAQTLVQLIWSATNTKDPASAYTSHYVTGDDVWLADVTVTEDGINNNPDTYDYWATFLGGVVNDGGANQNGGYIYGRIFQDDDVSVDDWYMTGPIVSAQNLDPIGDLANGVNPDDPQLYDLNTDRVNGNAIDGPTGAQVVPEPASLSLLLLGTVVVGLRRRKA